MATIDLKGCIAILERGDNVSMEVIQADINKGSAGKLLIINRCRIARNREIVLSHTANKSTSITKKKDPNHRINFTRNIELPGNQIITIHPILIHKINNSIVL